MTGTVSTSVVETKTETTGGQNFVDSQTNEPSTSTRPPQQTEERLVLRLVPAKKKKKSRQGVSWATDVVDNELLNKKKSKKCCIFHRQRAFGEWSEDEDSDAECEKCQ